MKYRQIGNSELWVSPISLGGNIFGYALNEKQTKGLLDFSIDNGVNFIDTADVYSDGESERIIGNAVQGERDKWIIASKVGLHSNGIATGLGKKKDILKRIEKSLKRGSGFFRLVDFHPIWGGKNGRAGYFYGNFHPIWGEKKYLVIKP